MAVLHRARRRHLDQLGTFEDLGPAQPAGHRMPVGQGLLDGADLRFVQRSLEIPAFDPMGLPAIALLPGIGQGGRRWGLPCVTRGHLGHQGLAADSEAVQPADRLVEHGLVVVFAGRFFRRPDQKLGRPLRIRPRVILICSLGKLELGQRGDGVQRTGVRPLHLRYQTQAVEFGCEVRLARPGGLGDRKTSGNQRREDGPAGIGIA